MGKRTLIEPNVTPSGSTIVPWTHVLRCRGAIRVHPYSSPVNPQPEDRRLGRLGIRTAKPPALGLLTITSVAPITFMSRVFKITGHPWENNLWITGIENASLDFR